MKTSLGCSGLDINYLMLGCSDGIINLGKENDVIAALTTVNQVNLLLFVKQRLPTDV